MAIDPNERQRRNNIIGMVTVFAVAVAWNAWRLSSPSMWADEVSTVVFTQNGFSGVLDPIGRQDAVMAPYYFFIEAWTSVFGTSDAAFRFPSVLAIGLAASATFLLARQYVGAIGTYAVTGLVIAAPSMTRNTRKKPAHIPSS